MAAQELLRLSEENPEGLSGLDPVKDLHLRDIDLVEQFRSLQFMQQEFAQFQCVHCPKFDEHVSLPACLCLFPSLPLPPSLSFFSLSLPFPPFLSPFEGRPGMSDVSPLS